jgi:release factor glutamine methyltransferase
VTATDISSDALAVAAQNARQLDIPDIDFVIGDWTKPVAGRIFNVIVSNPPYVCAGDAALDALRHEPRSALVSGDDGLNAIRTIARDCAKLLERNGMLLVEHGAEQQEAVEKLFASHGWVAIACHKDYAGLPRVTIARCR